MQDALPWLDSVRERCQVLVAAFMHLFDPSKVVRSSIVPADGQSVADLPCAASYAAELGV